jgi:hypothetical protein
LGAHLKTGPTVLAGGFATLVSRYFDLHSDSDLLDENLLHETPAEFEQCFDVEGVHTPHHAKPMGFSPLRSSANLTVILDFLTHRKICGTFEGLCVVWVITLVVRKPP